MRAGRFLAVVCLAFVGFVLAGCGDGLSEEERNATVLPSGLRYKDTKEGKGPEVKTGDALEVFYTGTLKADGKKFDSNEGKDSLKFILGEGMVIKGWDEGLVGMKAGGKRRLWIPAELGYGPKGAGPIPANSDLIFDVELVRIIQLNEDEKDATVLPSGLKILDQLKGTGASAKAGDQIAVHYTGTLASNGSVFDSSRTRGQPIEIQLGARQVIQGWDEGIVGMQVGGKRKLFIPPDLAYGPQGRPPTIPPNAKLVFEVELMSIK